MLAGKAGYFNIAKLKFPDQALENDECVRPFDGVVVKMSVRGNYDVHSESGKIVQEPLWVRASRIIPPRVGQHRQTFRRRNLECIVAIKLNLDIACAGRISALFLNGD